jgi:hypothetical protein
MPDKDTMYVILGACVLSLLIIWNCDPRFGWLSPPMMRTFIITIGDSPLLLLLVGLVFPAFKEHLLIAYVIYCGITCIIYIYYKKTWLEIVVIMCVVIVVQLIWGFAVFGMWTMIRAYFRCDLKLIAGEKRCEIFNQKFFHVCICLSWYVVKLLCVHIFGKKNDLNLQIVRYGILKRYCDQHNIKAAGNKNADYVKAIKRSGHAGDLNVWSKANV